MPDVSFADRLEAYFKAWPDTWIDGRELAKVAGAYGWRTRVSDVRKRGMVIENRQIRHTSADGKVRWVESQYRYVKPKPVQQGAQPSLFQQEQQI